MSHTGANLLIRVYGDSLSLPRAGDGIGYFDTYPELLRDALEKTASGTRVGVLNRSRGGEPVLGLHRQFVEDGAYMGVGRSDLLIIQCGIVDCAPRPVPPPVKSAIGRLPTPLRWLAAKFLHYARPLLLGAGLKWRNTGIEDFETVLDRWLGEAAVAAERTYLINIAPTTAETEKRSPGLSTSIEAFNGAIARVAGQHANTALVDVHAAIAADVPRYVNTKDGHHITRDGHRLYTDLILALERQRAECG